MNKVLDKLEDYATAFKCEVYRFYSMKESPQLENLDCKIEHFKVTKFNEETKEFEEIISIFYDRFGILSTIETEPYFQFWDIGTNNIERFLEDDIAFIEHFKKTIHMNLNCRTLEDLIKSASYQKTDNEPSNLITIEVEFVDDATELETLIIKEFVTGLII